MTIDYNDKHKNYKKKITAIAYARYSSLNQREESIDAQLRAIGEYADREEITIVDTYYDERQTGTNADRDEFQRMIDDILHHGKEVDFVLVHKFNRFARSKTDSIITKKMLRDKGIRVVSVTQKIDETPEGEMFESFIEAMDEYYSRNLALEVKKGMRENAINAKHTGGRAPFGYDIINGRYVINDQADVVRRIFRERALGASYLDIVCMLNAEGIKNAQGRPFKKRLMVDLLRNEKYIGVYSYKLDGEIFRHENAIPAIIDKGLWNKVIQANEKKKMPQNRTSAAKVKYLLTGYVTCSKCGCGVTSGSSYNSQKTGERIRHYACHGKTRFKNGCKIKAVRKQDLEIAVLKTILGVVANEDFKNNLAGQVIAEINKVRDIPQSSLDSLKAELKEIKAEQLRIATMYQKGKIPEEMLDAQADEAAGRLKLVETEMEKQQSAKQITDITQETVIKFIDDLIAKLPTDEIDNEIYQSIFKAFLDKIEMSDDVFKIYVKVDFATVDIINCNNDPIAQALSTLSQTNFVAELRRSKIKELAL